MGLFCFVFGCFGDYVGVSLCWKVFLIVVCFFCDILGILFLEVVFVCFEVMGCEFDCCNFVGLLKLGVLQLFFESID